MASQLRRRRGRMRNSINASDTPLVVGQKSLCKRFSELVVAVVPAVSVDV
jgi:hypothetical protein